MAVANRRKSSIVVDGETYYWGVHHIPGDDYPSMVVVSADRPLCFHYPLDEWTHRRFMSHLSNLGLHPPIPGVRSGQEADTRNPAFNVTPRFVGELIRWCLANDCLTTPGRSSHYPSPEEERRHAAWAEVAKLLEQQGLAMNDHLMGVSLLDPGQIAEFLRDSQQMRNGGHDQAESPP